MILDGRSVVDKKIITFDPDAVVDTDSQIQPNGVDLRVNKIYEVRGKAVVPRDGRAQAEFVVQELEIKEGYWTLAYRNRCLYYVDFLESIYLLDGYLGQLHTRSSLVRAGIDVMSGLWDTGFQGRIGCTLRVHSDIHIEWAAPICQIVISEGKFSGQRYSGRYQNQNSHTAITYT